jgi:hypothetical protein
MHNRVSLSNKKKFHRCKLCTEKLLCDVGIIAKHMDVRHKTDLAIYKNMVKTALRKETSPVVIQPVKKPRCGILGYRDYPAELTGKKTFSCFICPLDKDLKAATSKAEVNNHLSSAHGINLMQYYKLVYHEEHWCDACL